MNLYKMKNKGRIEQKQISERTLSEIISYIKKTSLIKNKRSGWKYNQYVDEYPLDSGDGTYSRSGNNEFILEERLKTSIKGIHFSQLEIFLSRVSEITSEFDIGRSDLPQSNTNPRNSSYCKWDYILEIDEYMGSYYDSNQKKDVPLFQNKRLFLEKFNEEKWGLLNTYNYPDFEIIKGYAQYYKITKIINGEEKKLKTNNKIRNLFHNIFVNYAKNRL